MPLCLDAWPLVGSEPAARPEWVRFAPFLLLYGAGLFVFATFALGAGSLHHDMTEAWAWGKEFQLGYAKHPPVSAWLVGAWFKMLPRTDTSFYLLSTLNVLVALAGVWALAGLFLDGRARWLAILLLVPTPWFNLWALKFNANAPLLSAWPWTTYFFLRSLRNRHIGPAIAAGTIGAIALLTKYYSLVLFVTLFMTALLHPDRGKYFRSPAPYVTCATGLALISPHIWWMVASGYPTIDYAISKTQFAAEEARAQATKTVLTSLGLAGIPLAAYLLCFGTHSLATLRRAIVATVERRNAWLVCLAFGPFALTLSAYFFANARITTGFLIPTFFAWPIVFLVLSGVEVTPAALRWMTKGVAAIGLAAVLASPLFGYHALAHGPDIVAEPRRQLGAVAASYWRARFGRPLKLVAGEERLATAVSFYSSDAPRYFVLKHPNDSPWIHPSDARKSGVLMICPTGHRDCLRRALTFAGPAAAPSTVNLTPSYLGRRSRLHSFIFVARPPESPPRLLAKRVDGHW